MATKHQLTEVTETGVPHYYREEAWRKIACFYDPLLKLVLLPFGGEKRIRQRFVDFSSPEKREQVLDVCSGTGTLTPLVAQRVGSSGRVAGVDLSPKMIERARKKAKTPVVSFQKVNSERLPFPGDAFDKVLISFGLHEMPESARQNTLREVSRTLKYGGNLFVLDYNLPRSPFARLIIEAFVRLVEEEFTYRMLLSGSLTAEIEETGLEVGRQELICNDMFQMIQATKTKAEGNDG